MNCTVALLHNGKSTIQALRTALRNKFTNTFNITINGIQERVRVVVVVDGRSVSGFLQINQDRIGLPEKRLSNTDSGFEAHWPEARDIKTSLYVANHDVTTQQVIRPQVKEFWGVFKDAAGCKCRTIGPRKSKPVAPDGFSDHGSYTSQSSADRGLEKCKKDLPRKCKKPVGANDGKAPRQWWGVFKDETQCRCTMERPTTERPIPLAGQVLYKLYYGAAGAGDGLSKCTASLSAGCVPAQQRAFGGEISLGIRVRGRTTTEGQTITIPTPGEGVGNYTIVGSTSFSNDSAAQIDMRLSTTLLTSIRGSLNYNGNLLELEETKLDYYGESEYSAVWLNRSVPELGIFDIRFIGRIS